MTADPIRGEAHRVFARAYQRRDPQATEQQVLDAWNALPAGERDWLLNTAEKVPAGAQARAEGGPTHPLQDDDGTWYDMPCNCDRTGSADQMTADLELLRSGGPVIDRAMREAGFLIEEAHRARGRERTDEERAVLPPTRMELLRQAGGDRDGYLRLCREHGIEPDGPPRALGPTGLPGPSVGPKLATGGVVRSGPVIVGEVPR